MGGGGRTGDDEVLIEVLRLAQDLGFVGPGPVVDQVDHGYAFADAIVRARSLSPCGAAAGTSRALTGSPVRVADLGSGGGLPALVIAGRVPDIVLTLVETQGRRAEFLREAVVRLGLADRVAVVAERAETIGRGEDHRAAYNMVIARSFGAPAVTAECAAPLLQVGGVLIVSEPPRNESGDERWPPEGLAQLGMARVPWRVGRRHFAVLCQQERCPDRYPRRVGVPAKRPLF